MIAIIRIQPKVLHRAPHDITRLEDRGLHGISFQIPQVRVLKRTVHNEDIFEFKPLLFNYGFLGIPMEYLKNPNTLHKIRESSEIISGWFYRKPQELAEDLAHREEEDLVGFAPVLVKSITQEQLDIMFKEAKTLDVYDGADQLGLGNIVVLERYPFTGLSARILRKKVNGKVQVELLDSGLNIWLDRGSILYTPYAEEESYQD